MGASRDPSVLQIKGRAFEMGLSGTLMLCEHVPGLERYYEPDREFVAFTTLEECADKARYYLAHEAERARIAKAYHDRTRAEHLWQHRYRDLFSTIGLG
jgi:spore maturation protein CgeB